MPKVSIIILTYNRPHFLKEAIECILFQTLQSFEIIIIDNAADPEIEKLVANYKDKRINYLPQPFNRKISGGRNEGLKHVKGDFVFFLDDDDLLRNDGLEKLIYPIENAIDTTIAGSSGPAVLLIDEGEGKRKLVSTTKTKPFISHYLWEGPMGYLGLFKKNVFDEIGSFDKNLESSEDIDFYVRFFKKFKLAIIDTEIFYLRKHPGKRITSFGFKIKPSVAENLLKVFKKHKKILEDYPPKNYSKILRSVGVNLLRAGRIKKARSFFTKSIKKDPVHFKTYLLWFLSLFGYNFSEKILRATNKF